MSPSPLTTDALVERRVLKRRLMLWRFLGIVSFCLLLAALVFTTTPASKIAEGEHIARFAIDGLIFDTDAQTETLDEIAEDDNAHALLLRINSPGGTASGSEVLFNAVRRVAERKPVVVVMDDVAASGGYIVALAGDHIVARRNTVTGSIGVIFQWLQVKELAEKIGLESHSITSGPLKGQPDPFETPSEETLEDLRASVQDTFEWFVGLVAERRGLSELDALALSDGRVYTGGQALAVTLIDEIGGERDAVVWLEETREISPDLEIRDWSPQPWEEIWDLKPDAMLLRLLGKQEITLKGLVSLWLPGA